MKADLKKLENINKELNNLIKQESDLYKKALENGEKRIQVKSRKEVKTKLGGLIKIQPPKFDDFKEKWLWEEIRIQGTSPKVEAVRILSNKYPELFVIIRKRESKNRELNDLMLSAFNINPQEMSIPNLLKFIENVVEFKIKDRIKNTAK